MTPARQLRAAFTRDDPKDGLRANRAAMNRDDERALIYYAKALAMSAALFPSLVNWSALRTAQQLLDEALANEPR